MTPQALNLAETDIPMEFPYIIYSPEHGLISEHMAEEDARAAFESFVAEVQSGEYHPFLLRRCGDEWEFA
jgi:hypothetical protein